jgi:hypothetical protein
VGTHIYIEIGITLMKKIIVLAIVAIASQAVAVFAGEEVSSKQVIPPPPPPPPDFFRPNEFDIGAFGEAWISLIGFHGNMQVSGSKGPDWIS